jgi:hypothetical protein
MSEAGCPTPDQWRQHLEGALTGAEQAALDAHLGGCPICQKTLEGLAVASGLLDMARGAGNKTVAAGPALKRVLENAREEPTPRREHEKREGRHAVEGARAGRRRGGVAFFQDSSLTDHQSMRRIT